MMERGTLVRLKSRAAVSAPGSAPRLCPPSLPPALPPALPQLTGYPSSCGQCPVWVSPVVGRRWFRRRRKPGPAASAAQTRRRGQRGGRRLFLLVALHNRPLPPLLRGTSEGPRRRHTFLSFCGSKAEAVAQAAAAVVRLWTRFVPPIPSETWGEGLLDAQCLPLLLVACAAAAWSGQWHVSF